MGSLEEQTDRYIGRYLDASFSYWNTLLTINGLILAFFSSDIFFNPAKYGIVIYVLLACCLISISLIIFNYRAARELYYDLATFTKEDFAKLDEKEREKLAKKDKNRYKWKEIRDTSLDILISVEVLLIILQIITNINVA